MIYLDNAATTRAFETAAKKALYYSCEEFYNPAASYQSATKVSRAIKDAAVTLSSAVGCLSEELIFTSGATESNNTVFKCAIKQKQGNVVLSSGEHSSVYECAKRLAGQGQDVRFVKLLKDGRIDEDDFLAKIDSKTTLVSVIHVSNETGVINDIERLNKLTKNIAPSAFFHSDGVQAFCKIPLKIARLGIDFYSVSAHKVGGIKGVGALFVKSGINIPPLILGGAQQNGRRAGTDNVPGILAFAEAAKEYSQLASAFDPFALSNYIKARCAEHPAIIVNGDGAAHSGYILSLSFLGVRAETLARLAEDRGVIVGLGSACSPHIKANRVLTEMKLPKRQLEGSIRLSISPKTTLSEISTAMEILIEEFEKQRRKMQ